MTRHDLIIFDVDDVMVDMDALVHPAQAALRDAVAQQLGPANADRIMVHLEQSYATLRGQLRAPVGSDRGGVEALVARIHGLQRGVVEAGHEVKPWSRQVLLALALEDLGLPRTAGVIDAGVQAYWAAIEAHTQILPDAEAAILRAHARGQHVHLATNSDGWLSYDEARGTFVYDPEQANTNKRARLHGLCVHGLSQADITVGDPIGKPFPGFYTQVLADVQAQLGRPVDLSRTLVVGDSLSHDVLPFLARGAPHGAWLLRREQGPTPRPAPEHPGVFILRSLDELQQVQARWEAEG